MIKLKDLLVEDDNNPAFANNNHSPNDQGDAADQAHKLGLVAAGWGYWKDKTGKTVARTIDGYLVKVDDETRIPGTDKKIPGGPHPNDEELPQDTKNSYAEFEKAKFRNAQTNPNAESEMSDDEFNHYMDYLSDTSDIRRRDPYWDYDFDEPNWNLINKEFLPRRDFENMDDETFGKWLSYADYGNYKTAPEDKKLIMNRLKNSNFDKDVKNKLMKKANLNPPNSNPSLFDRVKNRLGINKNDR